MPYSITPVTGQVNEGAGSITFTITRTGSTVTEAVRFSTIQSFGFANIADYGTDTTYQGALNVPLTFTSTIQQRTVTLLINNDSTPEQSETFGVFSTRPAAWRWPPPHSPSLTTILSTPHPW